MSRRHTSLKRFALGVLCTVLGFVFAVMLSVTLYFQYLLQQINYVEPEGPTVQQQVQDAVPEFTLPPLFGLNGSREEDDGLIGGKNSQLVNILLIGQDRREGEDRARSDSMILCTFNRKTGQITMTSFLRDLYVKIPGYYSNRINAAYTFGGMSLLNETLETNFGIHVDGNVEVDFSQFAQIIDLLGGVPMEIRQDEAENISLVTGIPISAGTHILNGEQALAYSRIRSLDADGDFSRTSRQRKVINALLSSYKNASVATLVGMLDDILPMVTTDMGPEKIISHAFSLFPMLAGADIVSQRIPADGTYSGQMIDGMAVLVADMDATRQYLQETLLGTEK